MGTTLKAIRRWSVGAWCLTIGVLWVSCEDVDSGNEIVPYPVAVAGKDTVVAPDSAIVLRGSQSYHINGTIETVEWWIEGGDGFVASSTGDTSISAPSSFDTDFMCILRVTDGEGRTDVDTMVAIVSWIRSPNGGEVFQTGDSLRLSLVPVYDLVDVRLLIERGGDQYRVRPPGATSAFVPADNPEKAYYLPDSIYDLGRMVAVASDSCRIEVFRYNEASVNVRSRDFFCIETGQ